eukprot:CAMPEP_0182615176 /NCGR_PEP_ID=MMETSP1330-20130603/33684_1 /TAXON_ID=464278 /ORGANISM="Picochlorum sp., Strain RCC944" /LENGTH=107 /DNA_ID=CAMNT_0024835073 /DNA_START=59 /DNA_END=379 /DNA_ORIENTATION=-
MEGEHAAYVLRLLRNEDVSADLREKSLYCLWTDYGNTWYRSVVEKCDPASGTASLYYEGTQEREEASLFTLIRDGEVAFKEVRRGAEYVPVAGEILVTDDVKIDECE